MSDKFSNLTDTEIACNAFIQALGQGITVNEGARNIYRAFGHDVILTPDDQLIEITDAPAVEHADGRKYKADGTVYDE